MDLTTQLIPTVKIAEAMYEKMAKFSDVKNSESEYGIKQFCEEFSGLEKQAKELGITRQVKFYYQILCYKNSLD